jgi:hypothetical protein
MSFDMALVLKDSLSCSLIEFRWSSQTKRLDVGNTIIAQCVVMLIVPTKASQLERLATRRDYDTAMILLREPENPKVKNVHSTMPQTPELQI